MLAWFWHNTLWAAVLAGLVLVACRLYRFRPAVRHALWLLVLLKLLAPAWIAWPWSPLDWLDEGRTTSAAAAPQPFPSTPVVWNATFSSQTGVAERAEPDPPAGLRAGNVGAAAAGEAERRLGAHIPGASLGSAASHPARIPGASLGARGSLPAPESTRADKPPMPPRAGHPPVGHPSWWEAWWPVALLGLWAAGGLVMLWLQVGRAVRFGRLVAQGGTPPRWLTDELGRLAGRMGVRPPALRVVAELGSPVVWCFGRAKLLWPRTLLEEMEPGRAGGVILHELAHLRRRDHWVVWLEMVGACVWWWNPLFWYVRRRIHQCAEMACDAWVVWALPDQRRSYAEALIEVVGQMSQEAASAPAWGAIGETRKSFERRLTMIFQGNVRRKLSRAGVMAIGLFALVVIPGWSQDRAVIKQPGTEEDPAPAAQTSDTGSHLGVAVGDYDNDGDLNVSVGAEPAAVDAGGAAFGNPSRSSVGAGAAAVDAGDEAGLAGGGLPGEGETAPARAEGRVLAVRNNEFVEISLGADDGLRKGHNLAVFRILADFPNTTQFMEGLSSGHVVEVIPAQNGPGNLGTYLGRVDVTETSPDKAVCKILPEFRKGVVKPGDRVTTSLSGAEVGGLRGVVAGSGAADLAQSAPVAPGGEAEGVGTVSRGYRVVAVSVNRPPGPKPVWIKPGLRVDVQSKNAYSESFQTILEDVRVFAVVSEEPGTENVSLAVRPAQAEQLLAAAKGGQIQLALHQPAASPYARYDTRKSKTIEVFQLKHRDPAEMLQIVAAVLLASGCTRPPDEAVVVAVVKVPPEPQVPGMGGDAYGAMPGAGMPGSMMGPAGMMGGGMESGYAGGYPTGGSGYEAGFGMPGPGYDAGYAAPPTWRTPPQVHLTVDARTHALFARGSKEAIETVKTLVAALDTADDRMPGDIQEKLRLIRFRHRSIYDVKRVLEGLGIGVVVTPYREGKPVSWSAHTGYPRTGQPMPQGWLKQPGGLLIASGPEADLKQIERLVQSLDVEKKPDAAMMPGMMPGGPSSGSGMMEEYEGMEGDGERFELPYRGRRDRRRER
jgi:beta-lactamase regulating signal transducer with metallopeptidase domain